MVKTPSKGSIWGLHGVLLKGLLSFVQGVVTMAQASLACSDISGEGCRGGHGGHDSEDDYQEACLAAADNSKAQVHK